MLALTLLTLAGAKVVRKDRMAITETGGVEAAKVPLNMQCFDQVTKDMAVKFWDREKAKEAAAAAPKPTGFWNKVTHGAKKAWGSFSDGFEDWVDSGLTQGTGNCAQKVMGPDGEGGRREVAVDSAYGSPIECCSAPWLEETGADPHTDAFFANHRCLLQPGHNADGVTDRDDQPLYCCSGLTKDENTKECCLAGGEKVHGYHGLSIYLSEWEAAAKCCSGELWDDEENPEHASLTYICKPHTCGVNAFPHNARADLPQLKCTEEGAALA